MNLLLCKIMHDSDDDDMLVKALDEYEKKLESPFALTFEEPFAFCLLGGDNTSHMTAPLMCILNLAGVRNLLSQVNFKHNTLVSASESCSFLKHLINALHVLSSENQNELKKASQQLLDSFTTAFPKYKVGTQFNANQLVYDALDKTEEQLGQLGENSVQYAANFRHLFSLKVNMNLLCSAKH